MPSWSEVLKEIQRQEEKAKIAATRLRPSPTDTARRKYITKLSQYTGRNTICYYSGWLMRPDGPVATSVMDADKNGFMSAIHGLNRSLGLDLVLHTPGGDIEVLEILTGYLEGAR